MAIPHFTGNSENYQPTSSAVEAFVHAAHGEPHTVIIPMILKGMSYKAIAAELSTPYYNLSVSWVSRWVANNVEFKAVYRGDE